LAYIVLLRGLFYSFISVAIEISSFMQYVLFFTRIYNKISVYRATRTVCVWPICCLSVTCLYYTQKAKLVAIFASW